MPSSAFSQQFQNYIPLLEKYLIANDKKQYLESLTNKLDRKMIQLIVQPLPEQYEKAFKELKIPNHVQDQLKEAKLLTSIRQQKNEQNKNKLVDIFIQNFYKNVDFVYSKPIQTVSFQENQIQEELQKIQNNKLVLEQDFTQFLQKLVENDQNKFTTLSDYGIKQLQQNFIMNLSYLNKQILLNKIQLLRTFNDQFVVDFIINYANQTLKLNNRVGNFYQQIPSNVIEQLSISQINKMKQKNQQIMKNQNFIRKWFELNYLPKIQMKKGIYMKKKITLSEMEKRRQVFVSVREELKKINSNFLKPYINNLFVQILTLDLKRQDPSKELFYEYLQNMQNISSFLNQKHRQTISLKYGNNAQLPFYKIRCEDLLSQSYTVDKLISSYLQKLFKKYKNHQQLKNELAKYLDFYIVNSHFSEFKLKQGQDEPINDNVLSKHQLQSMKNKKQITIVQQKTQSFFKAQDNVVLTLRLKNVKQIKMKIYQMDLEQYYLENINKQIDQRINLLYLNPSIQEIIEIKGFKNSYQVIEQQLVIDKIQKKYGFYIVQLQGQGLTSRAVIRKGAIVCFQQNNIDGKLLKFYDQTGQSIKNLNIWIKGRNQIIQNGQYLIPFSKKNQSFTIIAVKDKYAEKINVNLTTQTYSFKVGLIYNHQSFIVGKKAKFILHPTLKLGNQKISLLNLKNIRITVDIINNLNIKSSNKFQNVKFNDQNDYILQIPIKSYTKSINITVQSQVKDLQNNTINLNFVKKIDIDLLQGVPNVLDFYLKRSNNGKKNIVKITGLNGEVFPGVQTELALKYFGTNFTENKSLKSNQLGQIDLGQLNYVSQIKLLINTEQGTFSRTWKFSDQINETAYFENLLTYYQNQLFCLPLPFSWNINQQNLHKYIIFSKIDQKRNRVYLNKISEVQVKIENGAQYLIIPKIQGGYYQLNFLKINKIVPIYVIEGKKWKNGQIFHEQSGTVFKLKNNPYHLLSLGQCKQTVSQSKQNLKKVSIPINIPQFLKDKIDLKSLRVHLMFKNYHDSYDESRESSFNFKQENHIPQFQTYELTYKKSSYLSNKTLSDQQSYVLNRANQKQFIGNNLQKPRIFLKRIQVRQTKQDEQKLSAEGGYQKQLQKCADMGRRNLKMACGGKGMSQDANYDLLYGGGQFYSVQFGLNSHNNYLKTTGHSNFNIKQTQMIQIQIPKTYSQVIVNLFTTQTSIKKYYYLSNQQQKKNQKDLRHCGLLQKKQKTGWSMSRQIYPLYKGEKKQISRDTLWCLVSLSNILQFASLKGHKIPEWITQWSSYSQSKKFQIYDKQICHQLNVFIYYKDNQFFIKYIKPFIKNKVTKTFVDLFLLNDLKCLEYGHSHKMKQLNEFEKILLIQRMMQNNLKEKAIQLATSMQLYQKSIKRSFEVHKELFDIIINSEVDSTRGKVQKMQQPNFAFGIPPPPPAMNYFGSSGFNAMMPQMAAFNMPINDQCAFNYQYNQLEMEEQMQDGIQLERAYKSRSRQVRNQQRKIKAGFKQVQKTKQYIQTTYSGIKNPKQSPNLVQPNLFWAKLASYITSQSKKQFITDSFLYLSTRLEFVLASCFLPIDLNSEFQLNNSGQNLLIQANNSFLIFVKQVKQLDYADKFGFLINQRFSNPDQKFTYEDDGTQIQKFVDQFLHKRPYDVETVITNTSGTNLQLQILIDIPTGSLPLLSHQYVQIVNATVNAYSTTSFTRSFYFPETGQFQMYPANASRNNLIIAKAKKLPKLIVKNKLNINKLETLNDVMRSGSKKQILEYIQKRNIYDQNIFSNYSILWMLNDKQFFNQVINILRKRNYYDPRIWSFSILHKDYKTILEYIQNDRSQGLRSVQIPIFEYFPYYSTRTHKFLNENKSTIRNIQFKQTYQNFLIGSLLQSHYTSSQKLAFAYYLMLQDRIDQSALVFKTLTSQERKKHQIQSDYLDCYLSMYQDYPNFTVAYKLSEQYKDYPIISWKKLFKQVYDTLQEYKNDIQYQQDQKKTTQVEYKTNVVNQGKQIKISVPPKTKVQVYFYDINLEIYFSDYPFSQIQSLSVIKPKLIKSFSVGQSRQQRVKYQQVQNLSNIIVQVYQFKQGVAPVKISSFFWANPKIKVKMNQNQGNLQVFYDGKKQSGSYVKVYSNGAKGSKFYRDGYTDITGSFKYALNDLNQITKFSILTITKQGGIINQVNPPEKSAFY